jgi:hypothetical protein
MPSRARVSLALLGVLLFAIAALPASAQTSRRVAYVPFIVRSPPTPTPEPACQPTGSSYAAIPIDGLPTLDIPAEAHPDMNLAVRGWQTVNEFRGLVDYNGAFDSNSPQLYNLFANGRTPGFSSTHRINDWDWANMRRAPPRPQDPAVTLLGMATTPAETLHLPGRAPDIYQGVYHALVLYATNQRISFVYTRNDYIAPGYGVHIENVCVDPNLVALYNAANAAGRRNLPGLRGGQAFGRARSTEILVAIRDTGSPMDPRSRKDWWRGRAALGAESGGQPRPPPPTGTPPTATPTPTPLAPLLGS